MKKKQEVKHTPKCHNKNEPITGTYKAEHRFQLFFDLWTKVAQRNFVERIWR